jgi:hypothetical protein
MLSGALAAYGFYQKREAERAKELAVSWSTAAGMISCNQESALHSLPTNIPTSISFLNRHANKTVLVYWISHNGDRKLYGTLGPGKRIDITTYISHWWVITDTDGSCEAIYQPEAFGREIILRDSRDPTLVPMPPV